MIGKIINYNDNIDVYTIIDNDGNTYYGFGYFEKDDIVEFEYRIINPGISPTLIAVNIRKIENIVKVIKK